MVNFSPGTTRSAEKRRIINTRRVWPSSTRIQCRSRRQWYDDGPRRHVFPLLLRLQTRYFLFSNTTGAPCGFGHGEANRPKTLPSRPRARNDKIVFFGYHRHKPVVDNLRASTVKNHPSRAYIDVAHSQNGVSKKRDTYRGRSRIPQCPGSITLARRGLAHKRVDARTRPARDTDRAARARTRRTTRPVLSSRRRVDGMCLLLPSQLHSAARRVVPIARWWPARPVGEPSIFAGRGKKTRCCRRRRGGDIYETELI